MVSLFIFGCAVGVVVGLLGPMVKNALRLSPELLHAFEMDRALVACHAP